MSASFNELDNSSFNVQPSSISLEENPPSLSPIYNIPGGGFFLTPLQAHLLNKSLPSGIKFLPEEQLIKSINQQEKRFSISENKHHSIYSDQVRVVDSSPSSFLRKKKFHFKKASCNQEIKKEKTKEEIVQFKCRKFLRKIKKNDKSKYYYLDSDETSNLAKIENKVKENLYSSLYEMNTDLRNLWNFYFASFPKENFPDIYEKTEAMKDLSEWLYLQIDGEGKKKDIMGKRGRKKTLKDEEINEIKESNTFASTGKRDNENTVAKVKNNNEIKTEIIENNNEIIMSEDKDNKDEDNQNEEEEKEEEEEKNQKKSKVKEKGKNDNNVLVLIDNSSMEQNESNNSESNNSNSNNKENEKDESDRYNSSENNNNSDDDNSDNIFCSSPKYIDNELKLDKIDDLDKLLDPSNKNKYFQPIINTNSYNNLDNKSINNEDENNITNENLNKTNNNNNKINSNNNNENINNNEQNKNNKVKKCKKEPKIKKEKNLSEIKKRGRPKKVQTEEEDIISKVQLIVLIKTLSISQINGIIKIVSKYIQGQNQGSLEFNLDKLPEKKLKELSNYVKKCVIDNTLSNAIKPSNFTANGEGNKSNNLNNKGNCFPLMGNNIYNSYTTNNYLNYVDYHVCPSNNP